MTEQLRFTPATITELSATRALLEPMTSELAQPQLALWYAHNAISVMLDDIQTYEPLETPIEDVRLLLDAIAEDLERALGRGTMPDTLREYCGMTAKEEDEKFARAHVQPTPPASTDGHHLQEARLTSITQTINGVTYTFREHDHIRFVRAAERSGFTVEYYHGRCFWEGPAITVNSPTEVAAFGERIDCQWDHHGKQFVVYPAAYPTHLADVEAA